MNITKEMEKIVSDTTIWTPFILPSQSILIHQGSEITQSYYIKEGILKVYNNELGKKKIINLLADKTLLPFDNFTDKTSFVNIKTIEKSLLYSISDTNYRQLRKNNPLFNKFVEEGLRNMMDSVVYRSMVLLELHAKERYKAAIKYFPCVRRMSNAEVARFINITTKRFDMIKNTALSELNEEKENGE